MTIINIYKCPKCIKKTRKCSLVKKRKLIFCKKCKSYYPVYKNFPVLTTDENDFLNLKKSLLKPKFRIFDNEN